MQNDSRIEDLSVGKPLRQDVGLPLTGHIVLFDTEYTSWEGSQSRQWSEPWEHREVVELGAVRVRAEDFSVTDQFRRLTTPHANPQLSSYFSDLTGIRQEDLEKDGVSLSALLRDFAEFGEGAALFASNGDDRLVLDISAGIQGFDLPIGLENFQNLRKPLAQLFECEPNSLTTGLLPNRVGLPVDDGVLHSAVDDAIALARTLGQLRIAGQI